MSRSFFLPAKPAQADTPEGLLRHDLTLISRAAAAFARGSEWSENERDLARELARFCNSNVTADVLQFKIGVTELFKENLATLMKKETYWDVHEDDAQAKKLNLLFRDEDKGGVLGSKKEGYLIVKKEGKITAAFAHTRTELTSLGKLFMRTLEAAEKYRMAKQTLPSSGPKH